jgi:hypothetical protein
MLDWRWFNRPRHPLMRLLVGVLGVALVAGALVLGFFALIAFAFIGGIVALTRAVARNHAGAASAQRPTGTTDARVIEGEYVIVHDATRES